MARRWARGRAASARPEDASDSATAAFLRHRAEQLGQDDAAVVEIGEEETVVVNLFFALATQWLRAGMTGIRVGLDYAKIAPTAALRGVEVTPAMFDDLQLMESAALVEIARQ